jgi:hypothetical protein
MTTNAQSVIDFISGLHGMDHLQTPFDAPRQAVIDLHTAAIIEADPDDPDCQFLLVEYPWGLKTKVFTHKLVDVLLVRNSEAMAVTNPESGDAQSNYEHIKDHFIRKTGVGLD